MEFNISNHPTLGTITRTVSVSAMEIDTMKKEVVLKLKINHYLDGVHIQELVKDIVAIADNTYQVPTGEPAPEPTEENPNPQPPTMGEYDYWMMQYEADAALKQMLTEGIANMDVRGTINEKCKYS